jgi:glycine/D-amino acid oxidase-like deaminating enzyme
VKVLVVGCGLAGSLLALELRQRGLAVAVIDGGTGQSATAWSYGGVAATPPAAIAATPLGRLLGTAAQRWQQLEQRYGPLGWRSCGLRLHGGDSQGVVIAGRVDTRQLMTRLPVLLAAEGVELWPWAAVAITPSPQGSGHNQNQAQGWRLRLANGETLTGDALVLAAGAGCRALWPELSPRLRISWAGVFQLAAIPPGYGDNQLLLPSQFQRLALERRAAELDGEGWVVDVGLAPWGEAALAGQISLVRPQLELGSPPEAALMEERLRAAWRAFDPTLERQFLAYQQVAVSFCDQGLPLVGPVPNAPGLWQFSGFSGGFSQVPVLAPILADAIRRGGGKWGGIEVIGGEVSGGDAVDRAAASIDEAVRAITGKKIDKKDSRRGEKCVNLDRH